MGKLMVPVVSGALALSLGGGVAFAALARPFSSNPDNIATPAAAEPKLRDLAVVQAPLVTVSVEASGMTRQLSASGTVGDALAGDTCKAFFYSDPQETANGETFDPMAMTAAHKTLRFNTMVHVTNLANGKSVVVRINDRGSYVSGRCLDLSLGAMKAIGGVSAGVVTVLYEIL